MDKHLLVLLIHGDPADAGLVRAALNAQEEGAFRLQCVESLPTALARIGGGDVDAVLLDLSLGGGRDIDRLDGFLRLRREAPRAPIVVLCAAADEDLALTAVRAGATNYVVRERCDASLGRVLRAAIEQDCKLPEPNGLKEPRTRGGTMTPRTQKITRVRP